MIGGFRKTSCSITGTIHELVWGTVLKAETEGGKDKIWLGINGIKNEVSILINRL